MPRLPAGPRTLRGLLLGAALLLAAAPADAQYFGRNKVQYEDFEFQVLTTEHFDIYYYPREERAARAAGRMAERWYYRLSTVLNHELSGRQPLILYATQAQFQQTNVIGGGIGEGTGGVTEALRRRIVLPVGGSLDDLDHVVGHELVHAFQYDITGTGSPNTLGAIPGAAALPLWFIEGMAEFLSLGPVAPQTAMWMRGALQDTTEDSLPSFRDLNNPRFFPYRYGHAFLAYLAGRYGDQVIGDLLRSAGRRGQVEGAIIQLLGVTPDDLVARWHAATHAAYRPLGDPMRQETPPGELVLAPEGETGRYNIAPSLSPDGSRMIFFSDRGLFSIDLYLADARTGEIIRQVTETSLDPHFQLLQFVESAGSWSPDGRQFVVAVVAGGRPVLQVYDAEDGGTDREIEFEDLGEIVNPAWSPDGSRIAFAALRDGLTDLYVYDLERDSLAQLTSDPFADIQPAWSPDGRSLAFVTERFTTDLTTLEIGPSAIGVLELETGEIRRAPGPEGAKQINPQWSPNGTDLYYVSSPNGIPNIYRVNLATGAATQVTSLFTGVSGITETSPAISIAQRSGRLAYTRFLANGYAIYAIEDPGGVEREVIGDMAAGYQAYGTTPPPAAVLPPPDRERSTLADLLRDPTAGLPAGEGFESQPYDPSLALTYIGQPSLVAGTSQFGTYIGGGASLYWSDMLGNHNLITGLQLQGSFEDLSAVLAYYNLEDRLNWGLGAQQSVYRTGGFAEGQAELDGEPVLVQQQLLERQINREVYGQLIYPFSTAQRVEFTAGYSNISFDRELQTRAFSLLTGNQVLDEDQDLEVPGALNLGIGGLALVYDNSFFGATAPILGQRYRLEVSPRVGSIDFVGVLGDWRRYAMPVRPFTLAARLFHFGRYGSGGEDERLRPLFLGTAGMVRGYSFGSFDASECDPPPDAPDSCPVFDQLLGSRMAVVNLELRFPLLGLLGLGPGFYGALPLEFLAFADAGLAWDTDNDPRVFGLDGTREAVTSAGFGLRLNLLGFAVAQLDLVRPFDRPDKNWVWQFELQPGF